MNITKKMKSIGCTSLAVLTLVAATSIVSFASTESDKPAKTSAAVTTDKFDTVSKAGPAKASETDTTVMPDNISIIKSGDGIEIQTITTDKIDNANVTESGTTEKFDTVSKAEQAKADTDKAK